MAMEQPDFYRLLQIDPTAEPDIIRAAYRALAAKHHPDVGGDADLMAELNRAYAVLSDPLVRASYDRRRQVQAARDRWASEHTGPPEPVVAAPRDGGTTLDFGRYAGWTVAQVAREDPDFLEWLARTPNGRRYHAEIAAALRDRSGTSSVATEARTGRFGRR